MRMQSITLTFMKQLSLVLLFTLFGLSVWGQIHRSNFWPFGTQASLDFSSGSPVVGSASGMYTEATSSMSDTLGNLLFYSDGLQVYDSTHAIMPNGGGLFGCSSSSQGVLIVPMPQHPSLYYLFTTSCYEENFYRGARYSVIDMSLNGGLGDVTLKNQLISLDYAEELAGTYHTNNCDVWIVFHELANDHYASYLLSDTGLSSTPVISAVGATYTNMNDTYGRTLLNFNSTGTMAVQTARINTGPKVHHFDRSTGVLSAFLDMPIKPQAPDPYSACFAPNDSLLYVKAWYHGTTNWSFIFQYDLTWATPQTMSDSAIAVVVQPGDPKIGQLHLGPDGKIYFSYYQYAFLGTIDQPNLKGMACGPNNFSLPLGPHYSFYGLPNFVSQFTWYGPTMGCAAPVGIDGGSWVAGLRVYPNPFQSDVTFDFEPETGVEYRLVLADMLGRIVAEYDAIKPPFRMERNGLTAGMYAYTLLGNNVFIGKGKLRVE
jgi:hypothetical protein